MGSEKDNGGVKAASDRNRLSFAALDRMRRGLRVSPEPLKMRQARCRKGETLKDGSEALRWIRGQRGLMPRE